MRPRRQLLSPGSSRLLRFVGATLLATGVVIIWSARLASPTNIYLSEMGAPDAPAPLLFNSALLVVALGGVLVAVSRRGIRSRVRWLALCTISTTLVFSCLCIAVASRVTCTPGCPVPLTAGSSPTDFVHTLFASLGFAGVGVAIIQAAFAGSLRRLSAISIASGALIITASGIGGLFSVFHFQVDLGGWLELAAATTALLWVILFALVPVAAAGTPPVAMALSGSRAPTPAVAPPATS